MFTEARLYFCDCKLGGELYHCHRKSQLTPSPPRGTCGEYCLLLWQKQWASLSAAFTLTRWSGRIVQGAQAKCGPPLPPILSIFTSMWRGSLTTTLSLPWPQRRVLEAAALELPAAWCKSCQGCYFRELDAESKTVHVVCVGYRDSQFPVQIRAHARTPVLSQHQR